MTRPRVLVCDDEAANTRRWADELRKVCDDQADVTVLEHDALAAAVRQLEERRRAARKGGLGPDELSQIDAADILVVDYDLLELPATGDTGPPVETGERVAYLARGYSHCGYIVGLNQFHRGPTFDLTLGDDLQSYADLNISDADLTNPGLWMERREGFRPWHWPNLLDAAKGLRSRAAAITADPEASVLETIGFAGSSALAPLTRGQLQFLSDGDDPQSATFEGWVADSSKALRRKDAIWEPALALLAAARLFKWVDRSLLAGQDVFVDAPHLALRYPSLLTGDPLELASWQFSATVGAEMSSGLRSDVLDEAAVTTEWRSRPMWRWHQLVDDERITEVSDPWSDRATPFVFCEDISRFAGKNEAELFTADVGSSWNVRHIRHLPNITYSPQIRLVL